MQPKTIEQYLYMAGRNQELMLIKMPCTKRLEIISKEIGLTPDSVSAILPRATEFARMQTEIDCLKAANENMTDMVTVAEAQAEDLEKRVEILKKQLYYSYSEKDVLMARLNKADALANEQELEINKLHKLVDSYIVENYPIPEEDNCPK